MRTAEFTGMAPRIARKGDVRRLCASGSLDAVWIGQRIEAPEDVSIRINCEPARAARARLNDRGSGSPTDTAVSESKVAPFHMAIGKPASKDAGLPEIDVPLERINLPFSKADSRIKKKSGSRWLFDGTKRNRAAWGNSWLNQL